jgi:hypothetical protein
MNKVGTLKWYLSVILTTPQLYITQFRWFRSGSRNSLQQDKTELVSLGVAHDLKEVCGLLMNDPESRGTDSGT